MAGGTIYVRCPYLLTDYFGLIVSSVGETIELHGGQMILGAGESARHTPAISGLPDRSDIAGAILILPPEPGDELVRLRDRRSPSWSSIPAPRCPRTSWRCRPRTSRARAS